MPPFTGSSKDRKSTRLNSSHRTISYAVFCLKKNIALSPVVLPAQDQSATPPPEPAAPRAHSTTPRTDPALFHPAALTAKAPDQYEVTFKTTAGDFVVQVTR